MELVELGSILHMEKGKKPLAQQSTMTEGFLPYVDIKAFERGIVDNYAKVAKSLLCEEGDLLIVCDGSRSGLTGRAIKGVVGSTLSRIYADGLDTDYLRYFIQSKYTLLNTQKKGTGTPHLNVEILKKSKLVVPSLEKQKGVVSRIEELFSSLDNAVETLNKTKEQLAVYRQAVLEEEFKEEEKWEQCSLGSLMTVVRNGYGSKPDDCGAYRILTIGSVRALNLDLNNYRLNNTPFNDDDLIAENDLLFTRYNGNADFVGCCARVPQICEHYAYPDKLIKFRPKLNNIYHSKYLEYFVSHGNARKYLRSKIKTTSGQNGIAGSDIKKLVVFLPTLKKQTEIVLRIEECISRCNTVEVTVNKALQEAEAMRQSILKEAFEGRLN